MADIYHDHVQDLVVPKVWSDHEMAVLRCGFGEILRGREDFRVKKYIRRVESRITTQVDLQD